MKPNLQVISAAQIAQTTNGLFGVQNPTKHAQKVIDVFSTVYKQTTSFIQNKDSAIKGLLISGDAGTGKTHWVQQAFIDLDETKNAEYIKGGSISAPALFVKLWLNRAKGRTVILDDCDIIHRSGKEKTDILELIKAATEPKHRPRKLSWPRASRNQLMIETGCPQEFEYDGTVIWITNDRMPDIKKATKQHFDALMSRFNPIRCYFNDVEKLDYTLYLIAAEDMLGKKCKAHPNGYSKEVIEDALEYIKTNYDNLIEITPRVAIKIADLRNYFPQDWKMMADNQIGNWRE
jgi:chromosomal replication initiation ATPase DnaA